MPVEPLLTAAERAPAANAAPDPLLVLLSLLSAVELEVNADVDVLLLAVVFVLTLLSVFVLTLLSVRVRLLWSVDTALLLVLPLSVNWSLATCAKAALLNPNAIAMAEAMSDFFMEPPEVSDVE
jgi:hypothetical protein